MKLLIASDIHGSAYYCRLLLTRLQEERPDTLLLLGDLLYHGPRNDLPREYAPKEVIRMLNDCPVRKLCVRGNCEAEVDQMVLNFAVLADYAFFYTGDRQIFLTHGHRYNLRRLPPSLHPGDLLLHGHTHVPAWQAFGNRNYYLNPGSVSLPKEESPHSFMTFDGHTFVWLDVTDGHPYHTLCL